MFSEFPGIVEKIRQNHSHADKVGIYDQIILDRNSDRPLQILLSVFIGDFIRKLRQIDAPADEILS